MIRRQGPRVRQVSLFGKAGEWECGPWVVIVSNTIPRVKTERLSRRATDFRAPAPASYSRDLDTSRIDTLRALAAQDPKSVFVRYGLAMEYVKAGEWANAIPEFEAVMAADPAYSAAYYHGGQTLEKMGRLDDARHFYQRGLDNSKDPHARSELEAALGILGE